MDVNANLRGTDTPDALPQSQASARSVSNQDVGNIVDKAVEAVKSGGSGGSSLLQSLESGLNSAYNSTGKGVDSSEVGTGRSTIVDPPADVVDMKSHVNQAASLE